MDTHATAQLLGRLERRFVLEAIAQLDAGAETRFAESTKFDLLVNGKRYPPKRACGLALQLQTGLPFGPTSFKGGDESACFRALRSCGFTIGAKGTTPPGALIPLIREVLECQVKYSSSNTPDMQRRGEIIRKEIPDYLRERLDRLEPAFTGRGFSVEVEGSDGVGRKNESPWVRLFDSSMSPSATTGWYIVLHFSRLGDAMYVTTGCGATTFKAGSLVDIAEDQLVKRVDWARRIAARQRTAESAFTDVIELHGNHLSKQFERATAFCRRYAVSALDESEIWADLNDLAGILVQLYEQERLGRAPLAVQPDLLTAEREVEVAVNPTRQNRHGQGRGLTAPEREAVELRAMELAHHTLTQQGFEKIRDYSSNSSYDYSATKDGLEWLIEVKGTTSPRAEAFLLTAPELRLHQSTETHSVLILVSQIELEVRDGGVSASGGSVELHVPWDLTNWEFEPTAFRATRRSR